MAGSWGETSAAPSVASRVDSMAENWAGKTVHSSAGRRVARWVAATASHSEERTV